MIRRLATTDTLLVSLSVAVIVLVSWPREPDRQQFQLLHRDGTVGTYSLAINDPALNKLRQIHGNAHFRPPAARLALAKWTYELASFYRSESDRDAQADLDETSAVNSVAYDRPIKAAGHEIGHWETQRQRAKQSVLLAEQQMETARGREPRVVMGSIESGPRSRFSILLAILSGMLVAVAYLLWRRASPTVELNGDANSEQVHLAFEFEPADETGGAIAMQREVIAIPANGLRLRQPRKVQIRLASVSGLVLWAMCVVVVYWRAIGY